MRVAEVRKFCKLDEAGEGLVRGDFVTNVMWSV